MYVVMSVFRGGFGCLLWTCAHALWAIIEINFFNWFLNQLHTTILLLQLPIIYFCSSLSSSSSDMLASHLRHLLWIFSIMKKDLLRIFLSMKKDHSGSSSSCYVRGTPSGLLWLIVALSLFVYVQVKLFYVLVASYLRR